MAKMKAGKGRPGAVCVAGTIAVVIGVCASSSAVVASPTAVTTPAAVASAASPVSSASANDALLTAEKLLAVCKPTEALGEVERGLKLEPNNALLYIARANIEIYNCQYQKAITDATHAIELKPQMRFGYAARARAFMWLGQYDKAKADYEKAGTLTEIKYYRHDMYEVETLRADSEQAVKEPAKKWALACTGFLFAQNHEGLQSLAGMPINENTVRVQKNALAEWWGVHNRDELLEMIHTTRDGCHNPRWLAIHKSLKDGGEGAEYMRRWQADDYVTAVTLVKQHGDEYGNRGILAWDLCRCIALCRWGYVCGFITEAEAWEMMLPAAARLQSTYTSWDQMANEYLVGRQFWNATIYREGEYKLLGIKYRLLHDPASPWVKLAWRTPLGVASGGGT